jgi:hypothetical protein
MSSKPASSDPRNLDPRLQVLWDFISEKGYNAADLFRTWLAMDKNPAEVETIDGVGKSALYRLVFSLTSEQMTVFTPQQLEMLYAAGNELAAVLLDPALEKLAQRKEAEKLYEGIFADGFFAAPDPLKEK